MMMIPYIVFVMILISLMMMVSLIVMISLVLKMSIIMMITLELTETPINKIKQSLYSVGDTFCKEF